MDRRRDTEDEPDVKVRTRHNNGKVHLFELRVTVVGRSNMRVERLQTLGDVSGLPSSACEEARFLQLLPTKPSLLIYCGGLTRLRDLIWPQAIAGSIVKAL